MTAPEEEAADVMDDLHKSIARLVLDHARREYDESNETWRDIEQKAQGTIAIAGIFLGGGFALVRSFGSLPPCSIAWFALAGAGMLVSIVTAIAALLVRTVVTLETSDHFRERAEALIAASHTPAEFKTRIRELVFDHARNFDAASAEVDAINSKKAGWVGWAQMSLLVAVLLTAVGLLITCLSVAASC